MRSTVRVCLFGLGVFMMVCSMAGYASATPATVPEIDGGSISTGLAGLTAAILILRARRRSK